MRNILILLGATALSACGGGGGGLETVGSSPPPATPGSTTPAASGVYAQFTAPTEAKTYVGVGGHHVYEYNTDNRSPSRGQQGQLYAGNGATVRNSSISIAYDPRDAIFTLKVLDSATGAETNTRFQDPGSRTAFNGALEPQWGTPNLANSTGQSVANPNIRYLQAADGDPRSPFNGGKGFIDPGTNVIPPTGEPGASYEATTFFYEVPGTTTKYVTFAGFVRNEISFSTVELDGVELFSTDYHTERGAFAYGALTQNGAVPRTGTATFNGSMLATMVFNPLLDTSKQTPTFYQWLTGTSQHTVDFAKFSVNSLFQGWTYQPLSDGTPSLGTGLPTGTRFDATASAVIDLIGKGGFSGQFSGAKFTRPDGTSVALNIAGSSIDGAFYGPAAEEIGGGFRVVGGMPDQRVDVLGAFTGKK